MTTHKQHPPHTLNVSDYIWEQAKEIGEKSSQGPATVLRNILIEKFIEMGKMEKKDNGKQKSNPNRWGTPFKATFDSACRLCGRRIKIGDTGFKCDAGSLHPDCYDKWVEGGNQ